MDTTQPKQSGESNRTLSIRTWSGFAGANQSKVVDLLIGNGLNVGLVIAIVLLFVANGLIVGLIGAVFGLASLLIIGWLLRREVRRRRGLLGLSQAHRVLLMVAVAGGYLLRRPQDSVWVWIATGLAVLAILTESTLRTLLGRTRSMATHLPGVPDVTKPPFNRDLIAEAPLAVALLGGILAAFGAPGWCYLVVVVAGIMPTLIMAGYVARSLVRSRQAALGVPAALEKYQPEFVVFYGTKSGARYQLGMWLPYLERLNRPFVVITLHASTVAEIAKLTSAPILVPRLRTSAGRLVHLVVPSMRAAFYVQNSVANLQFQRFSKLTHVWLNHGDSDKAANFSSQHATFDKIFVSGQQGVDRYAAHGVKIQPEQFAIVGRPQIETIEVHDHPLPADAPRTVLYAPTWHGGQPATNYSSLPLGSKIVAALLRRGVTVIFRPHPHSYRDPAQTAMARQIQRQLEDDQKASGRAHVWGKQAETDWDIPACFNHSDALITDVSSVASDFLASGKPMAMVAIRQPTVPAFRREVPMARVSYVIKPDLSTLESALDDLLGDDPLAEQRRAYRTACLGDALGEHAADEFLRTAGAIVSGS